MRGYKMNSDSSDEENLDLLREAANNEFTVNLFTANGEEKDEITEKLVQKRSLRPVEETEVHVLNITPQVQTFIAKRLFGWLESEIEEIKGSSVSDRREYVGGVHLFSSSKNLVSSKEEELDVKTLNRRYVRRYPKKSVDGISEEERCREAAVSADWILSQEAVSGWEVNTKGKVEVFSAEEVEIKTAKKKCENQVPALTVEEKKERKRLKKQKFRERVKLQKLNVKVSEGEDSCEK